MIIMIINDRKYTIDNSIKEATCWRMISFNKQREGKKRNKK